MYVHVYMCVCVCVYIYIYAWMLSRFYHVWLCEPINYSLSGSSVPGILQARILEWVATPSRRSSRPRDQSQVSRWWFLYCLSHQGSPSISEARLKWTWGNPSEGKINPKMAAQGLPLEMDRLVRRCPGARVCWERRRGWIKPNQNNSLSS